MTERQIIIRINKQIKQLTTDADRYRAFIADNKLGSEVQKKALAAVLFAIDELEDLRYFVENGKDQDTTPVEPVAS